MDSFFKRTKFLSVVRYSTNGRATPAVPVVMRVSEALLLVWQAGAVGSSFSRRLSYAHGCAPDCPILKNS